jgi:hypothetical protein
MMKLTYCIVYKDEPVRSGTGICLATEAVRMYWFKCGDDAREWLVTHPGGMIICPPPADCLEL